jgi:hypothetical protein
MEREQVTRTQALVDRGATDPGSKELAACRDAMLRTGQVSEKLVNSTNLGFARNSLVKTRFVLHPADPGGDARAGGARKVTFAPKKRTQMRLQPAGTASGFDPLKKRVGAYPQTHGPEGNRLPRRLCWVKR